MQFLLSKSHSLVASLFLELCPIIVERENRAILGLNYHIQFPIIILISKHNRSDRNLIAADVYQKIDMRIKLRWVAFLNFDHIQVAVQIDTSEIRDAPMTNISAGM